MVLAPLLILLAAGPVKAAAPELDSLAAEQVFEAAQMEHFRRPKSRLRSKPLEPVAIPDPTPKSPPQPPKVCSGLNFSGVAWPGSFSDDDRSAFELALNISGSYEGDSAWVNLTNNFDGQGVSMGLLNQNLGQGSLQPMLIRMRDEHPDALKALVSPDHLKSLLAMLAAWRQTVSKTGNPLLSPLDKSDIGAPEPDEAPSTVFPAAFIKSVPDDEEPSAATNAASVAWAVKNLYKEKAKDEFDLVWLSELTDLASSPEFIGIQIDAAMDYHMKALADENEVGVRQLRDYLLLFDFQVQNGGLYQEDLDDYHAFVKKLPGAGATQKLEELLTLRLRHVRKRFAQDVKERKEAIIRGTGKVHDENRDLPTQYCYDGLWPYR